MDLTVDEDSRSVSSELILACFELGLLEENKMAHIQIHYESKKMVLRVFFSLIEEL